MAQVKPADDHAGDERAAEERGGRREMNRLYAVEPTPSNTGSVADHRLPLQASAIQGFALGLAGALGVAGVPRPASDAAYQEWVAPLARDLEAHRGASVVIVGD
jgi:molybdopterin-containing oxidoreductase family iron-sulfur binding subunit